MFRYIRPVVALTLVFSFLFLAACASTNENETTKIRLFEVTRSIFYAPQYVALTKGFFCRTRA